MLSEGAELTGESGTVYLVVSPLGQANVWTAVQKDKPTQIVVIKEPNVDETRPGWPTFIHEMVMHELFKSSPHIRRSIDRIPVTSEPPSPPMLVLEIFQTTLWTARTKRPLSKPELRQICKTTLLALRDIHAQDLVYADLKMQNIMLNGFNTSSASTLPKDEIETKLGDLGIVTSPARGQVQPIPYRAPEVYFKGQITPAADIWSWGLIYSHLLEAQTRFAQTGIYDDLGNSGGNGSMQAREDATKNAIASDYDIRSVDYYNNAVVPPSTSHPGGPHHGVGHQWSVLHSKGLEDHEIRFLRWVMKVDPRERPTAQEILDSGWLEDEGKVRTRWGLKSFAPLADEAGDGGRPVSRSSFFRSESDPALDTLRRQVERSGGVGEAAVESRSGTREGKGGKSAVKDGVKDRGKGGEDGDGVSKPAGEEKPETPRPVAQRTFLSYR